jgi:2-hydroxy-3-keto-5-methylthiopentenyl-1-phosphate phosphatase
MIHIMSIAEAFPYRSMLGLQVEDFPDSREDRILDVNVFTPSLTSPLIEQGTVSLKGVEIRMNSLDNMVGHVLRQELNILQPGEEMVESDKLSPSQKRVVERLLGYSKKMEAELNTVVQLVDGKYRETGEAIRRSYEWADSMTEDMPLIDRIAARVAVMGGEFLPTTDFDKTATDGDDHIDLMPTKRLEALIKKYGRENFATLALSTVFGVGSYHAIQELRDIAKNHVRIRKGFNEFVEFSNRELNVRPVIISANFQEFVEAALENVPAADNGVRIISVKGAASEPNVISTRKDKVVEYLARLNPHRAVTVAGDGDSDVPALDASDNVAVYFALENAGFEKKCHERGVFYLTYGPYSDITRHLKNIKNRIPAMREFLDSQSRNMPSAGQIYHAY